MKHNLSNKNSIFRSFLLTGCLILSAPAIVVAEHSETRSLRIEGINVTGANRLCGQPVMALIDVPAPIPVYFGGEFVGEYDSTPGATDSIPLSPDNCDEDIVLATYTDDDFIAALGAPEVDSRLLNVPLRNVPVNATPDGIRISLPLQGTVPANPFPAVKSSPNGPITLGEWLGSTGVLRLRCRADGSASVRVSFRNLIPNGLYTMWGTWVTTPPGAPGQTLAPLPLGGVPNAIVANRNGRAFFHRELAACPLDTTPDGSKLLFISTAYHSDGNTYGATPDLPLVQHSFLDATDGSVFQSTIPAGIVDHDAMNFPINATRE